MGSVGNGIEPCLRHHTNQSCLDQAEDEVRSSRIMPDAVHVQEAKLGGIGQDPACNRDAGSQLFSVIRIVHALHLGCGMEVSHSLCVRAAAARGRGTRG